jgi:hypothetical protein
MAAINKANVLAAIAVYGIARGVVDDVRAISEGEQAATDATVFNETMAALEKKEEKNG